MDYKTGEIFCPGRIINAVIDLDDIEFVRIHENFWLSPSGQIMRVGRQRGKPYPGLSGVRFQEFVLSFFEDCSTFELAFNSWICSKASDKETSDRWATICWPLEANSSNDILKLFFDFIGYHLYKDKIFSWKMKVAGSRGPSGMIWALLGADGLGIQMGRKICVPSSPFASKSI